MRLSLIAVLYLLVFSGCRTLPPCWCRVSEISAVTDGRGNDTEVVWSPDGKSIAFQTDRYDKLRVCVLNLDDGKREIADAGTGDACYPAWTPDGGLIYAVDQRYGTAVEDAPSGDKACSGCGLRLLENGVERVLTQGYWRDYTPVVSSDGKTVYYTSTRNHQLPPGVRDNPLNSSMNGASIWRLNLVPDNSERTPECVYEVFARSFGSVQPSLSPDGRTMVWAQIQGFRQNWRLCAAQLASPYNFIHLTPPEMSAYAPRISPDGRFIAFTGFMPGDPSWGVYVQHALSGGIARLDTGPGNSKSPCWSPDGRELIYENNRSGFYKIYRARIDLREPAAFMPAAGCVEAGLTGSTIAARLQNVGALPVLKAAKGEVTQGRKMSEGGWSFRQPGDMVLGKEPFFVKVRVVIDELPEKGTQVIAMGVYREHPLGWQLYLRENGHLTFGSRDARGDFVGVQADAPADTGRALSVLAFRDAEGLLKMAVDGRLQHACGIGPADIGLHHCENILLEQDAAGKRVLKGRVVEFECGQGYPASLPRITRKRLFAGEMQ